MSVNALPICSSTAGAVEAILQQARAAKINSEFPTFALGRFRQGMATGYGEEEPAALIKVLRGGAWTS
jgi:hypothetical protein